MASTVQVNEENSAGHTVTQNVSNMAYGSTDAANLDPVANPIAASSQSYTKWNQFHVTAMGGSSAVQNLKIYSTAPGTNWSHYTNANPTAATYNTNRANYASPPTPVATDQSGGSCPTAMPTSAPGTANLGIGGALDTTNGKITTGSTTPSASVCSDWLGTQMKSGVVTAGGSVTITWQYDEVA